jgi:1,4-dihydroxy-2-naphthoate octaprenyltransferase
MSWGAYTMGALAMVGPAAFATAIYWWGYLCLFALEAATVFANDYFDFASDRENRAAGPFNGGSRMLVDGKQTFGNLRAGITIALAVAVVCAVFAIHLAPQPGAMTALLGIVFALTLGYTMPPLKLCWRGLGEIDVAVSHSFMVLFIGYLLQGGDWLAPTPWLLALPLGLSVLPAIILSGLPDRRADQAAGKGTLPVRLGARHAIWLSGALVAAAAIAALIVARLPATLGAYDVIVWGMVPHAVLLIVLLARLARADKPPADRRIDGVMVVALSYILWFVVVPFWHLV